MRLLLCSALLFISLLQAEPLCAQKGSEEVAAAFHQKDSEAISKFFREHVQLDICTSSGVFSQTQAERILADFFRKHPEANFIMDHVGNSEKNGNYCVGKYSESDKAYRVTYLLHSNSEQVIIRNLSISLIKKDWVYGNFPFEALLNKENSTLSDAEVRYETITNLHILRSFSAGTLISQYTN